MAWPESDSNHQGATGTLCRARGERAGILTDEHLRPGHPSGIAGLSANQLTVDQASGRI
jgi:hypothetical protein